MKDVIFRKANAEIIERLRRVSDGIPVGRPKDATPRVPWRPTHRRSNEQSFCSACGGCGRMNWFQVRKTRSRWEWKPFHPHSAKNTTRVPTMVEALAKHEPMTKGLLERIIDGFSHESE